MRPDGSWPSAALFDLDGTLIDSVGDLHASVNLMLARDGLGPLSLDQVRGMIGHGMRKLVERAREAVGRPVSGPDLDRCYDAMLTIYSEHFAVFTTLLPGAREALAALSSAGTKLALVTNKPGAVTEALLKHFDLAGFFTVVTGGDGGLPPKPAPDMLLSAARRLGVKPGDCLFVGDSEADARSARAAGMKAALVEGGYHHAPLETLGADAVLKSLADLPGAIERLRAA